MNIVYIQKILYIGEDRQESGERERGEDMQQRGHRLDSNPLRSGCTVACSPAVWCDVMLVYPFGGV